MGTSARNDGAFFLMAELNRYRLPGLEQKFSREVRTKAFLVIVQKYSNKGAGFLDESLEEMKELASSALMRTMGYMQFKLNDPSPSHFLREGKLTELRDQAKKLGANILIFNSELTASQAGNIQKFTQVPPMDRTGLILDIFGRRAKSKEGKLQVELAQLNYALPRIGGLGGVLSRLGGGVGTRGPGEQMLQMDKRKIQRRIQQVKEDLKDVEKHRDLLREGRKRKNFSGAALVGYTNAGKSTLMNALTGAESYVEDKLFATLDPVTRMENINGRRDVLFIDTVGFLRDLPHGLVEAFHATLEETVHADVLIHVLDVSSVHAAEFKTAVEKVLKEIGAEGKPTILALNKADLLSEEDRLRAQTQWPEGILISAKEKQGLQSLLTKLEGLI